MLFVDIVVIRNADELFDLILYTRVAIIKLYFRTC